MQTNNPNLILGSGGCGLLIIYDLLKNNNINVSYKGGKVKYQNSFEVFNTNKSLIWEKDDKSFIRALNYLNDLNYSIDISHYALPYIDEFIKIDPEIKIAIIKGNKEKTCYNLKNQWGYRNPLNMKRNIGRPRYALKQFPYYEKENEIAVKNYIEDFYQLAENYYQKYEKNVKIFDIETILTNKNSQQLFFKFLNLSFNKSILYDLNDEEEVYTTTLHGGLGNNLFQIAETYAFCKENNLAIPKFGTWKISNFPPAYNADNFLGRHKGTQEDFKNSFKNIEWLNNPIADFHTKFMINDMFDFSKVNHMRKEIINYLEPTTDTIEYIENKYNDLYINNKTISLHLRYCTLPADDHVNGYISNDYYIKTLNYFKDQMNILVFSDNNNRAKEQIEYFKTIAPQHQYYLIEENQFISLFMIAKCNAHILHVSTFSFWGAYLDKKNNSTTFYSSEFEVCHTPYMISKDLNWIKV